LEAFGVHPGNIREWDQTAAGVQDMQVNTSGGLNVYYAARSAGQTNTKSFFTVDMSQVSDSDIRTLSDLSSDFKVLPVNNSNCGTEWIISDFIEDRIGRNKTFARQVGANYQSGRGYYELTKSEKVQPNKDILVMDRKTGKIYGGTEARGLIGIPTNVLVQLKPGNHENWRIFVKSTSFNRKLVRGTDVLYRIR
jgi:hypothetical protein